jgi:hypothetical protein
MGAGGRPLTAAFLSANGAFPADSPMPDLPLEKALSIVPTWAAAGGACGGCGQ